MSEQRRIDLLFATTVRVLALARLARTAAPVLAIVLVVVVAVHGTLGGSVGPATPRLAMDTPAGFVPASAATVSSASPASRPERVSPPFAVPPVATAASDEPPRPVPQLDREQQNIARFIATRYRVTLDATSEFVYHAYRAARDVKVDPMLVLAVMSVESSFNPKAQSHAGAQGLMQVLTRVHAEKFLPFGGIPAAFDPVANIRVGSVILKEYIRREGTVEGALKSYVGAALAEHDGGYGMKVLNARERIAAAAAGRPIPPEVVAAPPAPRPAEQPVAQPVSTIVETRTPILPAEPIRPAPVDALHGPEPRASEPRASAAQVRTAGDI
jgi:soluble lytic murein transglycosylase-like protein